MLSVDPNIGGLTSVPFHLSCLKWRLSCVLNTGTASSNKTGIRLERALHISTWWTIIGNLGRFSQTTSAPKGLAGWIINVANKLHGDAKTRFKTSYVYVTAYDGWRARRPVAHDKNNTKLRANNTRTMPQGYCTPCNRGWLHTVQYSHSNDRLLHTNTHHINIVWWMYRRIVAVNSILPNLIVIVG